MQILNQHFFASKIYHQIYHMMIGDSIHVYLMAILSEKLPTAENMKNTTF